MTAILVYLVLDNRMRLACWLARHTQLYCEPLMMLTGGDWQDERLRLAVIDALLEEARNGYPDN